MKKGQRWFAHYKMPKFLFYDECQTQSTKFLTLPREQADQNNSNNTWQQICKI